MNNYHKSTVVMPWYPRPLSYRSIRAMAADKSSLPARYMDWLKPSPRPMSGSSSPRGTRSSGSKYARPLLRDFCRDGGPRCSRLRGSAGFRRSGARAAAVASTVRLAGVDEPREGPGRLLTPWAQVLRLWAKERSMLERPEGNGSVGFCSDVSRMANVRIRANPVGRLARLGRRNAPERATAPGVS